MPCVASDLECVYCPVGYCAAAKAGQYVLKGGCASCGGSGGICTGGYATACLIRARGVCLHWRKVLKGNTLAFAEFAHSTRKLRIVCVQANRRRLHAEQQMFQRAQLENFKQVGPKECRMPFKNSRQPPEGETVRQP